MLITYSKSFTVKNIRNLCRIKNVKYISNYNKNYILDFLGKFNAAKCIQDNFRRKTITEKCCPISHEPLKYPFICLSINKKFFYYDFHTFIEYLNKTQDFRDPCTRVLIADSNLLRINKLVRYYYGKATNKILISKSMMKNTNLNIITHCLYDVVKEIQGNRKSMEEMYLNVIPRFMYYINYLIKYHAREDAEIILNACKETIDNRVILDCINLIETVNY